MNLSDSFRASLDRLQKECPEVLGAVLATSEGLILAATGELGSDAAAASAVHVAEQVDRSLGLLSGEGCEAMLIWGESAVWCLVRLSGRYALMARAGADCRAGALKLAAQRVGQELVPSLASLDAPADAGDGDAASNGDVGPAYYASA